MRLGIDLGNSCIVVAAADRGNYPVFDFESPTGATQDWYPPSVALRGDERHYGWDAWARQSETGWTVVRSLKRILTEHEAPSQVQIGEQTLALRMLWRELAGQLKADLLAHSNLPLYDDREPLEVYLGVPADAGSDDHLLLSESFREGGFDVLGLLEEASAASLEFSRFHHSPLPAFEESRIVVYDLGGSTFAASMVDAQTHAVVGMERIESCGSDDFDQSLAQMVLERVGLHQGAHSTLTRAEWFSLREECRRKKEALYPGCRRIVVDLDAVRPGWGEVAVPVHEFRKRCQPFVEQTLRALDQLLIRHLETYSSLLAVYAVGGGSEGDLVAGCLRRGFGWRVCRSSRPRWSVAIGLAIHAGLSARDVRLQASAGV